MLSIVPLVSIAAPDNKRKLDTPSEEPNLHVGMPQQLSTSTTNSPTNDAMIEIELFLAEKKSAQPSVSIQYLLKKTTLYGVIETMFDLYLEEQFSKAIYSHMWTVEVWI